LTAYTESVLDRLVGGDTAVAPAVWPFEIANVVTVAERRRMVKPAQAAAFFQTVRQLLVVVDRLGIEHVFSAVAETARRYRLSAYDAGYLELALREALALATVDEALRNVAQAAGLEWSGHNRFQGIRSRLRRKYPPGSCVR
jgi:predicted nucleic acid-binding protein